VVVDTDKSAKALLEKGQLTKRVTIIPLNQVRGVARRAWLAGRPHAREVAAGARCRCAVRALHLTRPTTPPTATTHTRGHTHTHTHGHTHTATRAHKHTQTPHAQVRFSEAPAAVLSAAASLGAGKAQPALQLVGYEPEVQAAIKYAFGTAFVCKVRDGAAAAVGRRAGMPRLLGAAGAPHMRARAHAHSTSTPLAGRASCAGRWHGQEACVCARGGAALHHAGGRRLQPRR
jgi:hypothetical protein